MELTRDEVRVLWDSVAQYVANSEEEVASLEEQAFRTAAEEKTIADHGTARALEYRLASLFKA